MVNIHRTMLQSASGAGSDSYWIAEVDTAHSDVYRMTDGAYDSSDKSFYMLTNGSGTSNSYTPWQIHKLDADGVHQWTAQLAFGSTYLNNRQAAIIAPTDQNYVDVIFRYDTGNNGVIVSRHAKSDGSEYAVKNIKETGRNFEFYDAWDGVNGPAFAEYDGRGSISFYNHDYTSQNGTRFTNGSSNASTGCAAGSQDYILGNRYASGQTEAIYIAQINGTYGSVSAFNNSSGPNNQANTLCTDGTYLYAGGSLYDNTASRYCGTIWRFPLSYIPNYKCSKNDTSGSSNATVYWGVAHDGTDLFAAGNTGESSNSNLRIFKIDTTKIGTSNEIATQGYKVEFASSTRENNTIVSSDNPNGRIWAVSGDTFFTVFIETYSGSYGEKGMILKLPKDMSITGTFNINGQNVTLGNVTNCATTNQTMTYTNVKTEFTPTSTLSAYEFSDYSSTMNTSDVTSSDYVATVAVE